MSISDCVVFSFTKSKNFHYRNRHSRWDLPAPVSALVVGVGLGFEEPRKKYCGSCLSPEVERGIPCAGAAMLGWLRRIRGGENHLPGVSSLTYAGLVHAQTSNTENSA